MSKKRVACYIDGFNLYHAISALKPISTANYLKWVNLWSLSEAFIQTSSEKIVNVYYFSALAYWLKDSNARHEEYIKAISSHGVTPILGKFKKKKNYCKNCKATWASHEEKQSDVNIAAYLVHHAHLDEFDKALIISADSDLCHAIDLVNDTHSKKEINILVPPGRYHITRELRTKVDAFKIKQKHLKNNQLPDIIGQKDKILAKRPSKYSR